MYNNQMLRLEKSYTLEKYEKTLTTKEYYTKFVNFDETSESCKICDMYGKNWSCPPFENDVTDSWNKYDHLHLILLQLHYDSFITDPDDVSILRTTDESVREVTLITCTNGRANRLIHKAREIK